MKKIALIGDIVSSRKINNRAQVQTKLSALFRELNKQDKTIASPFTITLGDEFQTLYYKADNLFKDICLVLITLYPVKVKFSIGIGHLSTKINKSQSIGMDGSAFHNARQGLNELKNKSFLINIIADDKNSFELERQNLFLISHLMKKWKQTRLIIFNMLNEGLEAKEISRNLKISDKAVYKNITAGELSTLLKILNEISNNINHFIKKQ
ncbi:MAG: SatD family protein [Ignavibacteriaceae bacterium]